MKALTLVIAVPLAFSACSKSFLTAHPVAIAGATLSDSEGRAIGTARLWQEAGGLVHVDVDVTCTGVSCTALPPGEHGIHFHSVGSCVAASSPAFSSAGAHFNPLAKPHGLSNSAGPHAGDIQNLTIGVDGRGTLRITTDRISLVGGAADVFDADGTALVVHAAPDDQMSQPSGNSGARVACGVLKTVQ
ncbi:MAG: superoxide dismutase family protein [Gemmatimonadaceae bacterium]|nr:superoxide dismutase family protein [Gemmatimonadaceae bacterium]